jgi:hypothetical protein
LFFLQIKKNRLKFVKKVRISVHGTTSKGKKCRRGKIYLKGDQDIGSKYQLFEIENLHLIGKNKQHKKGNGYIVTTPK